MRIPTNPIAETIDALLLENQSHGRQIEMLTMKIDQNNATISALEPLGEWQEIADETFDNSEIINSQIKEI